MGGSERVYRPRCDICNVISVGETRTQTVPETILHVRELTLSFGALRALSDIELSVERGTVHSIIGPNGAGKTSLLNCLSGLYRPQSGRAMLSTTAGTADLVGIAPHRVARLGLARTFQNLQLFKHMSVVDNLMLGRHVHIRPNLAGAFLRTPGWKRTEAANRASIEPVIELLELGNIRDTPAGQLPYGMQKQVEMGRALSLQPELLLLDEPMAGTTGVERDAMIDAIVKVRDSGVTIAMIEHDMATVMSLSDTVTVFSFGMVIASGTPSEVSADPEVIRAYLGEAA